MALKKSLVALGLSAGLLGGGAAGAILGTPGLSGAQETTTTTVAEAPATPPAPGTARPDRTARLQEVLAPLVAAGTIDQAQADAVVAALEAARPADGPGHGHGRRGQGLEAAATALGMTPAELRTALRDGATIAAVAGQRGVAVQTVIDAMVAEAREHLAERVADGKLTQEQADARLAQISERITDVVNNGRPERGGRD